jgi:signal transduction histidine kinase
VFLLFPATLGADVRYLAATRLRELEEVKLRERGLLARELHDTVAHHVSAIVISAQAGRTLATSHPEAAVDALDVIEREASRTLTEMRLMVGAMRGGGEPDLAPQRGVADLAGLARNSGASPRVAVQLAGDLDDLRPSLGAALYRLAQESITNAVRTPATPPGSTSTWSATTTSCASPSPTTATRGRRDRASRGYGLVG